MALLSLVLEVEHQEEVAGTVAVIVFGGVVGGGISSLEMAGVMPANCWFNSISTASCNLLNLLA